MMHRDSPGILIVEDEPHSRNAYRIILRQAGFDPIHLLDNGEEVLPFLETRQVACILLDLNLPGESGETLLPQILANYPHIPVVILTGASFVETAVRCMKQGAFDFITKPVEKERLLVGIRKALEVRDLAETTRRIHSGLGKQLKQPEAFAPIHTASPAMFSIFHYMEAVAPSSLPVLITGETGSGKELIARTLHRLSGRKGQFVALNIAGLDETLISDSLFGHQKGAFTHAALQRDGMVAQAAEGTLFLDEIGEMPLQTQIKLLRFLQEGDYLPLGADRPRRSTARILTATNRNPEEMKEGKHFRKDLFFRIAPHAIHLPPLRERKCDIPLLMDLFVKQAAKLLQRKIPEISESLVTAFQSYSFPGNIRELQGLLHDAVSRCDDDLLAPSCFSVLKGKPPIEPAEGNPSPHPLPMVPFPTLAMAENNLICLALHQEKGNQTRAAKLLGISRQTLNRKLRDNPQVRTCK
ncbi:sigma-54 dependent transcriptional regulator [Desulfobotulus sp. H1]|uniref:Sigma-54 dependent transcriptional regulator n=1 Tax=Desulfobotulus pelophilus TaxID=2823377 RepID=A0ABT3NAB4_9BACT|nr:sigma-54 dependent transcriptional regulator [Desulfobotulus pelophilus]MCW7754405.1 sigma-54 dependent transcriptional regulator [Desulfobotulus pelophilus]